MTIANLAGAGRVEMRRANGALGKPATAVRVGPKAASEVRICRGRHGCCIGVPHRSRQRRMMWPRAMASHSWESQDIERVECFNLSEWPEVGVVKGQESGDTVLNHQGDETHIVAPLTLDRVFGNQAFPGGGLKRGRI